MIKCFVLIVMVLLFSACSKSPFLSGSDEKDSLPYGVWTTRLGHVIVITKNNRYVYCDTLNCMHGKVETSGAFAVTLKDFMINPVTQKLLDESGAGLFRKLQENTDPDFDFSDRSRGMSQSRKSKKCGDRPCVPIGDMEHKSYTFIKSENF